jgi:hypothetical protein
MAARAPSHDEIAARIHEIFETHVVGAPVDHLKIIAALAGIEYNLNYTGRNGMIRTQIDTLFPMLLPGGGAVNSLKDTFASVHANAASGLMQLDMGFMTAEALSLNVGHIMTKMRERFDLPRDYDACLRRLVELIAREELDRLGKGKGTGKGTSALTLPTLVDPVAAEDLPTPVLRLQGLPEYNDPDTNSIWNDDRGTPMGRDEDGDPEFKGKGQGKGK